MIKLAIVAPCYNEEEVLDSSALRLKGLLDDLIGKGKISGDSFVLFVNDGSNDRTWEIISRIHDSDTRFKGICLAHNVGHQGAIMAGMMSARTRCDALVTIDADLQDELQCIEKMLDSYSEGYDVVYGVKVERSADSALKRWTAQAYYKMLDSMGVETVYNHADFRFLSRRVLDCLASYKEKNLYLRALIPLIGFPGTTVDDHIGQREAGKSKYTLRKMLRLSVDGITSFTVKPLYLILYTGIIFVAVSLVILICNLVSVILGNSFTAITTLLISLWFIGGVVLTAIGFTGLYIGRIYSEVKDRPIYNIQEQLD